MLSALDTKELFQLQKLCFLMSHFFKIYQLSQHKQYAKIQDNHSPQLPSLSCPCPPQPEIHLFLANIRNPSSPVHPTILETRPTDLIATSSCKWPLNRIQTLAVCNFRVVQGIFTCNCCAR